MNKNSNIDVFEQREIRENKHQPIITRSNKAALNRNTNNKAKGKRQSGNSQVKTSGYTDKQNENITRSTT